MMAETEKQFNQVYDKLNEKVRKIIEKTVRQRDIDDVAQEVWIAAWGRLNSEKPPISNYTSWVNVVLRNKIADYCRRNNHPARPVVIADLDKETFKANAGVIEDCGLA